MPPNMSLKNLKCGSAYGDSMMWNVTIDYDDLPNGDMKYVADECGMDVAIELLKTCAGMNLYIPYDGNSSAVVFLQYNIGNKMSDLFIHRLAGMTISVPKIPAAIIRKVIRANYDGSNANFLAKQLNICERTVYNYLKGEKE